MAVMPSGNRTFEKWTTKYDIFLPKGVDACPLFVLLHGFGGSKQQMAFHAKRLCAEAEVAVLAPDMSSLMKPDVEAAQRRNIGSLADYVTWTLTLKRPDTEQALVDPTRVFLVGHSAGGAVCLEACVALAASGCTVAGVVLFDGVPWPRTTEVASQSFPVHATMLVSLRAEPSAWNMNGEISKIINSPRIAAARYIVPTDKAQISSGGVKDGSSQTAVDVLVKGSRHGDPVFPRDSKGACFMKMLGLLGSVEGADIYADLLLALAQDAWHVKPGGPSGQQARPSVQDTTGQRSSSSTTATPIASLERFTALLMKLKGQGRVV